jgi:hypothetical protein
VLSVFLAFFVGSKFDLNSSSISITTELADQLLSITTEPADRGQHKNRTFPEKFDDSKLSHNSKFSGIT